MVSVKVKRVDVLAVRGVSARGSIRIVRDVRLLGFLVMSTAGLRDASPLRAR